MGVFAAAGVIALIIGVMFILFPNALYRANEASKAMIANIDNAAFANRYGVGVLLIIASLILFFVAYYVRVRS